MKIALCMSGHMRAFERTHNNHEKKLLKECDYDVFVYTSDLMSQRLNVTPEFTPVDNKIHERSWGGRKNKTGIMYNVDKKLLENRIRNVYGSRLKKVIIQSETMEENLKVGYDVVEETKNWPWLRKTFEKTYRCNEMFKQYCETNDTKYDLVIRNRGDLKFYNHIPINKIELEEFKNACNNIVWAFGGWQIDNSWEYLFDGFAYGAPEAIDKYCSLWLREKEYEEVEPRLRLESQLYHHLKKMDLEVRWIDKERLDRRLIKKDRGYKIIR